MLLKSTNGNSFELCIEDYQFRLVGEESDGVSGANCFSVRIGSGDENWLNGRIRAIDEMGPVSNSHVKCVFGCAVTVVRGCDGVL